MDNRVRAGRKTAAEFADNRVVGVGIEINGRCKIQVNTKGFQGTGRAGSMDACQDRVVCLPHCLGAGSFRKTSACFEPSDKPAFLIDGYKERMMCMSLQALGEGL